MSTVVVPVMGAYVVSCNEVVPVYHREGAGVWYEPEPCSWQATEVREEWALRRGESHEKAHAENRAAVAVLERAKERRDW